MDQESINLVVGEIAPLLTGRVPGKIFQLGPAALAIDFGLRAAGYLYLNAEPAAPRLYLTQRRVRDLEKESRPLAQFGQSLRKELAQKKLLSIDKEKADRIVRLTFGGTDELGNVVARHLVAQLTGRSANLLILDDGGIVIRTLRASQTAGQHVGDVYRQTDSSRPKPTGKQSGLMQLIRSGRFATA